MCIRDSSLTSSGQAPGYRPEPGEDEPAMSRFLLGINYWPRRSAMYMWQQFDLDEIGEDMARIKALGLDIVRFFLMWEAFQPEPHTMDAEALRHFDAVMDIIAGTGLQAMPTLFCGHMSGVNWLSLIHIYEPQRLREQLIACLALDGAEELHAIAVDVGCDLFAKVGLVLRDRRHLQTHARAPRDLDRQMRTFFGMKAPEKAEIISLFIAERKLRRVDAIVCGCEILEAWVAIGIGAVSYTHLDVYKRQAQRRGRAGR